MLHTEFVPAPDRRSRWLMVVLHGLGDSLEGYRWLPEMLALPQLNFLLVNAPDSYYGGFSWYDFATDPGPGVHRSREALFALLDEQRRSGFPTENTFLFGFSQGCLMTLEVGARYPHRLAGLIGISGYAHEPERLVAAMSPVAREQQFLLTHGTRDGLIPLDPVKRQVESLRSGGLNIRWHEFEKDHTIAGEVELGVIRRFVLERIAATPGKGGE